MDALGGSNFEYILQRISLTILRYLEIFKLIMVLILTHFKEKLKNPIPGFIAVGLSILLVKRQVNAFNLSMKTLKSSRYLSFLNSVLTLSKIATFSDEI